MNPTIKPSKGADPIKVELTINPIKVDINHSINIINPDKSGQDKVLNTVLSTVLETQKTIKIMAKELDDLTAKVTAQTEALDAVSASISGVAQDQTFLKAEIQKLIDANPALDFAPLQAAVDAQGEKLSSIKTALEDLDAATDSSSTT